MFFKCKHPADKLVVDKEQTVESFKRIVANGFYQTDEDFEKVTYNLFCLKCGEDVKITHAKTKYGIERFLKKS